MNHPFSLIGCMRDASECLGGARSPGVWLRFMARATTAAAWFAWSCSSLEFLKQPPLLREGPLFGSTLELLTRGSYTEQRKPRSPQSHRARLLTRDYSAPGNKRRSSGTRHRSTQPSSSAAPAPNLRARMRRARAGHKTAEELRSRQQVTRCLEQSPNTSREFLLQVAAGEHPADPPAGTSRPRAAVRVRMPGNRRDFNTPGREGTRTRDVIKGALPAQDAPEGLARLLAKRVASRFGPLWLDTQSSVVPGSVVLADQWSVPLNGTAAPIALLEQVDLEFPTEFSTSDLGFSQQDEHLLSQNEKAGLRAHENASVSPPSFGSSARTERVAGELNEVAEHTPAITPDMRKHSGTFEIRQGVRPPAPVSMALIEAAEEEEDVSQEDLSVLSAKLKHILDEEARRHGIDV